MPCASFSVLPLKWIIDRRINSAANPDPERAGLTKRLLAQYGAKTGGCSQSWGGRDLCERGELGYCGLIKIVWSDRLRWPGEGSRFQGRDRRRERFSKCYGSAHRPHTPPPGGLAADNSASGCGKIPPPAGPLPLLGDNRLSPCPISPRLPSGGPRNRIGAGTCCAGARAGTATTAVRLPRPGTGLGRAPAIVSLTGRCPPRGRGLRATRARCGQAGVRTP